MHRATLQTNFTSGELDPELAARIDVEDYYNGAERLRNVVVKPSGGAARAPGSQYIASLRGNALDIVRADVTPTAPNGGTAANALDGSPNTQLVTTSGIGTTNPYVIAHYDMGGVTEVASAEVTGASIDVATLSAGNTHYHLFTHFDVEGIALIYTPGDCIADNELYARPSVAGDIPERNPLLRVSDAHLGDSIPVGATITGVEVRVKKAIHTTTQGNVISDSIAQLVIDGVRVGTNKASASAWTSGRMETVYGGPTDLWGWALTRDTVAKGNFGFAFAPIADHHSAYARIYNIAIRVYYTHSIIASPAEFFIQYSTDDVNWTNYGAGFQVRDGEEVSHRYNADVSAEYWRVARIGSTDLGAAVATIRDFNLTLSTDALSINAGGISQTKMIPFVFSRQQRYMLAFTDRNVAVFENRAFAADIASPFTGQQLVAMDFDQRLDTIVLTHADVPPQKMVRQGKSDKWLISTINFDNVPYYAFDPSDSNPAVTLTPSAATGNVILTASGSAFTSAHVNQYISGNGGRARIYEYTSATVVKAIVEIDFLDTAAIASGSWTLETGYEAVWSSSRGYPKTCAFYQNRLYFGGTRSLPDTVLGSRLGVYWNFEIGVGSDSDAIMATMENRDVSGINALVVGRHLQVFTESGEFFVPQSENVALTPSNFIIRNTAAIGTKPGVKPVKVGESTLFVQVEGESVRELHFRTGIDDTADAVGIYSADDITENSAHLIDNPVSIAHRRAVDKDKPNLVLAVNTDGTLAMLTKRAGRKKTNAWTLRSTDGLFRQVATLGDEMYIVVERTIDGTPRNYLEVFDENLLLDCAHYETTTAGDPIASLSGLDHLEGEEVQVIIDGALQLPLTVASGAVTFAISAYASVMLGLGFEPLIRPMPVTRQPGEGQIISGKKRVFETTIFVADTQWCEVSGRAISFQQFGQAPSPLDSVIEPYTGRKTLDGFLGWNETAQIDITQADAPLSMTIAGIERRVIV